MLLQRLCSQLHKSGGSLSRKRANVPGPRHPVLRSRGAANSNTEALRFLSSPTENIHGRVCQQICRGRRLPRPAKSRAPAASFSSMANKNSLRPCFYLCVPPKYAHGSCFFADLLGSKTITLLNADTPPFLINMQKQAPLNASLKCRPGTAFHAKGSPLRCSRCKPASAAQRRLYNRCVGNLPHGTVHPLETFSQRSPRAG